MTLDQFWVQTFPSIVPELFIRDIMRRQPKEIRTLAGNGMALRAVLVAICVCLRALDPEKLASYLRT